MINFAHWTIEIIFNGLWSILASQSLRYSEVNLPLGDNFHGVPNLPKIITLTINRCRKLLQQSASFPLLATTPLEASGMIVILKRYLLEIFLLLLTFPEPMRSYIVKENLFGSAVSEIFYT